MNIKTLVMESYIKVSGTKKPETEMVLVYSFGQTDQSTKACGDKTKQLAREE
jgi:hypothetical protein